MTNEPYVQLPGSERTAAPGAQIGQPLGDDVSVEATLVLRRRADLPNSLSAGRDTVSTAQLRDSYGADPGDIDRVTNFLTQAGAEVVSVDPGSRRIRFRGTGLASLFQTTLTQATSPDPVTGQPVQHRHREGALHIPAELNGVVTAVLGLDDRPQSRAHFRLAAAQQPVSYSPVQLGQQYDFPANTDGTGHTLAIIELGGGFDDADLKTYFTNIGVNPPSVTAVGVDGAVNVPDKDPNGADGEVLLDIEVAGALAPGASQLVYFAPNTDAGFLDAISQAVHANPTPTAISISWGGPENSWTAQARTSMDDAFADAAALGITVTVAAGDNGSSDGENDGQPHVDFPAASPNVLACGGTSLSAVGATEKVWNDGGGRGATGGGVSEVFTQPTYQQNAGVPKRPSGATGPGRGVPDVAGDADPETGYQVRVDGQDVVVGGTSAVAPLWAALAVRLSQATGRPLGLMQPDLYKGISPGSTTPGFHDVLKGNNGAYKAKRGYDACTGLGTPKGSDLLARVT